VVLVPGGFEVDEAATAELRRKLRAARGWSSVPRVSREPTLPLLESGE
jgi:hypothetical protein